MDCKDFPAHPAFQRLKKYLKEPRSLPNLRFRVLAPDNVRHLLKWRLRVNLFRLAVLHAVVHMSMTLLVNVRPLL